MLISNGFIGMIGVPVITLSAYMLAGVTAIIYQVLKVQDEETVGKERTVLFLSDPVVYWTVYWFVFWFSYFLKI